MSLQTILVKFAGRPPSSPEEVDELLSALIQKHAADDNKWILVAKDISRLLGESKTKQWCKNRAKTRRVQDLTDVVEQRMTAASTSKASKGWRTKLRCFRIEPIDGKGLGVVATEDMARGDVIIEEEPVLCYTKHMPFDTDVPYFIRSQWESLTQSTRDEVMRLHDASVDKTLAGVLRTNAFSRGPDSAESILCLETSRFNHSCSPNCQHAWDDGAGLERVFACTDIKAGDELCIYYTDVCKPSQERKRTLREKYGFDCACAACESSDYASDCRRRVMRELDQSVMQIGMFDPRKGIATVQKLLSTYEEEGLWILSLYGRACYDAFQLSLLLRDIHQAKAWIEKAHQYYVAGEGPENPSTLQMLEYSRNPRSHRLCR